MKTNSQPIGIFDSGLGGLTVIKEIIHLLPHEDLIYLGDTARVPYGEKCPETVIKYALQNAKFLTNKKVKCVVIACNTAAAFSLEKLNESLSLSCLGVIEPGAEAAVKATRSGKIGIIGTTGTIESNAYVKAIKRLNQSIEVFCQACPLFVPLVEEAWHVHPITHQIAEIYLRFCFEKSIDTLILGCTHYPLLKKIISDILGPEIFLIDSAITLAEKLAGLLIKEGLLNSQSLQGKHTFFVTDMPKKFYNLGKLFLKENVFPVEHIDITNY